MDEPKETECTGCNGGRSCLWITLCALLIFISLVAIAALVLAVMMMLQVIPVCNCAPSECVGGVCVRGCVGCVLVMIISLTFQQYFVLENYL